MTRNLDSVYSHSHEEVIALKPIWPLRVFKLRAVDTAVLDSENLHLPGGKSVAWNQIANITVVDNLHGATLKLRTIDGYDYCIAKWISRSSAIQFAEVATRAFDNALVLEQERKKQQEATTRQLAADQATAKRNAERLEIEQKLEAEKKARSLKAALLEAERLEAIRQARQKRISDWTALVKEHLDLLSDSQAYLETLRTSETYISSSSIIEWKQHFDSLKRLSGIDTAELDLPRSTALAIKNSQLLLSDNGELVRTLNEEFVQKETNRFRELFDKLESHPLTERQREAAICNEDCNLVVAGAGTGKTSTIVARVGYFLKRGEYSPDQFLILAFNKKAASELRERIQGKFGDSFSIRTFHAFALEVIGQVRGERPKISRLAGNESAMHHCIDTWLLEMLADPDTRLTVQTYLNLWAYPTDAYDPSQTKDEYYRRLRECKLRALCGTDVKSKAELRIANWLYVQGIRYEYETEYRGSNTADKTHSPYRPDFYLPDYDLYIEHFGIDRNGDVAPWIDRASYHLDMQWKRDFHARHATRLVITYGFEDQEGVLVEVLAERLNGVGVELRPRSWQDLQLALERVSKASNLAKLLQTFLIHYRERSLSISELRASASILNHAETKRAHAFLDLFKLVHDKYLATLNKEKATDFPALIADATNLIETGQYAAPFKQIIVDEFQDISAARARFLLEILRSAPHSRLFAVGDDWQSIYRFAGSDVSYMTRFEGTFGPTKRVDLDVTFRFAEPILNVSSSFVTRNPSQLKKDIRPLSTTQTLPIELVSRKDNESSREQIQRTLEMVVDKHGRKDRSRSNLPHVLVLSRYRRTLVDVPTSFPGVELDRSTVHSAKGLEADFVIVLDLECSSLGFPNRRADDPILSLVLPNKESHPDAEERRLFYVALTRAKRQVFLLIPDIAKMSEFVREIETMCINGELNWSERPAIPLLCPKCNGFLLKRKGPHGDFMGCSNYPYCRGKRRIS